MMVSNVVIIVIIQSWRMLKLKIKKVTVPCLIGDAHCVYKLMLLEYVWNKWKYLCKFCFMFWLLGSEAIHISSIKCGVFFLPIPVPVHVPRHLIKYINALLHIQVDKKSD